MRVGTQVTTMVAGALADTKYNWFIRSMMKRIAAKAGGDTDTSRDYEYTDWPALSRFSVQFARRVESRNGSAIRGTPDGPARSSIPPPDPL